MLISLSCKSPLLSIVRSIVHFNAYFVDLLMFSEMVSMLRNHLLALPLLAKLTWGALKHVLADWEADLTKDISCL